MDASLLAHPPPPPPLRRSRSALARPACDSDQSRRSSADVSPRGRSPRDSSTSESEPSEPSEPSSWSPAAARLASRSAFSSRSFFSAASAAKSTPPVCALRISAKSASMSMVHSLACVAGDSWARRARCGVAAASVHRAILVDVCLCSKFIDAYYARCGYYWLPCDYIATGFAAAATSTAAAP